MIESTPVERQVARLARVRDEQLDGRASTPAARALLAELVVERVHVPDAPPRRRPAARPVRRLALASVAVAAMTVAVVVGPSLLAGPGSATSYANSAIEVTRERDFFVARIKDPLADRAKYVEAFRAVGKDVDIELVPVSPRLIGRLLEASGGSGRVSTELVSVGPRPVDCASQPASCTMVVRIAAETTGTVRYRLGRAARPGEMPQDPVVSTVPTPIRSAGGSGD
jgi:hypothetical protein